MNISWSALALVLIFITPAFLLLNIFKIQFFPKIRTIGPNDSTLFLLCSTISLFFNFDLLSDMACLLLNSVSTYVEIPSWEISILRQLLMPIPVFFKFSTFLNNVFTLSIPEHNFFIFILELHLRTLVFGLALTFLVEGALFLMEYKEYLPYRKDFKFKNSYLESISSYFAKKILPTKINLQTSKFIQEKRNTKWIKNRINELRTSFYHPWSIITSTNRRREILMVDVCTIDGTLYSGKLSTWVPENNGISAISIEYALKYSHKKDSEGLREKGLIKNHGDLVIPATQISTYHFWEIRRHFTCNITIKSHYDIEILKWYLLLSFVHDDFITKITAQFNLGEQESFEDLLNKLNKWLDDNNILNAEELLEIQFENAF